MQNKKVKIIYFSTQDSVAKQVELSWGKFFSILLTTFVVLLFLAAISISLFTDFYQSMEIASLSKLNKLLKARLSDMVNQVTKIEARIEELEKEDDDLRIIASLPTIDSDTRDVGVGGFVEVNYNLPTVPNEIGEQVYQYQELIDKLERRVHLTVLSREEIRNKLEENKKIIKHTPSIRPLIGGLIRDKFGFRLHPLTERIQHHDGIDIAAERGTEVFATAAGVVEKVVTKYTLNKGYGKQVVINHGFDFKTRYGHLSKILVRKGQKVDRWTPIGLVGDTGLATGPHLHYEVIQEGKETDPLRYILN
ncbi:MAG: peptidoglycan DD-metalloendopeptidase family protein [bacterium]